PTGTISRRHLAHFVSAVDTCCCRKLLPAGLVVSSFKVRDWLAWRPFCWGLRGLMRSISMPSLSHHTDTLLSPKSALGLAKGTPLSVRMALGRPNSLKTALNTGKAKASLVVESASQAKR